MIGGLLYLDQTRLDIMNVVCIASIFQSDPRETHDIAVKRIFRYLTGTMDYGLWYPKDDVFRLYAYTDSDWAGDVDDQKRTKGGAFFLGNKLVSWLSKKQSYTSLSTTEVGYVVVATNYTQILWMKQMLKDIRVSYDEPIFIHYDDIFVIDMSKNPAFHSKSKHISIRYNFLKEKVEEKEVRLIYVPTKEQIVDILTKPFPKYTFEYLRDQLGVTTPPEETQRCKNASIQ